MVTKEQPRGDCDHLPEEDILREECGVVIFLADGTGIFDEDMSLIGPS